MPITSLGHLVQHLNFFCILAYKWKCSMEKLFFCTDWHYRASFSKVLCLQVQWIKGFSHLSFLPSGQCVPVFFMDKPYTRVPEVQVMPHFTSFLSAELSIHRQTRPTVVFSVILSGPTLYVVCDHLEGFLVVLFLVWIMSDQRKQS